MRYHIAPSKPGDVGPMSSFGRRRWGRLSGRCQVLKKIDRADVGVRVLDAFTPLPRQVERTYSGLENGPTTKRHLCILRTSPNYFPTTSWSGSRQGSAFELLSNLDLPRKWIKPLTSGTTSWKLSKIKSKRFKVESSSSLRWESRITGTLFWCCSYRTTESRHSCLFKPLFMISSSGRKRHL